MVNDLNCLTSFPEAGLTPETFEVSSQSKGGAVQAFRVDSYETVRQACRKLEESDGKKETVITTLQVSSVF